MNNTVTIAIDGPAAAGKSTVAKLVANKLSYLYIDTGAMYRAITLEALNKNIPLHNEALLIELLDNLEIDFIQKESGQRVCLNGEDITEQIRSEKVTNHVSYIAQHPLIRKEMLERQQKFAKDCNVVMDGRDIGTHVLPDAKAKFFLIASVDERAKRRHAENIKRGFESDINELKKEIEKRDILDSERAIAPLVKARDAIEIDTTSMSIIDVVHFILDKIENS